MTWFILAIISAAGSAATRLLIKVSPDEKKEIILFSRYFYALLPTILLIPFFGIPEINWKFYIAAMVASIADVIAINFMIKSLADSDMSRSVPLLALTPVFILLTGFILLKEVPNAIGLVGVVIVVSGSYALNVNLHQSNIFEPFKLIVKERSARNMLVTAFLFSIAAPCFKIAVINSSPVFTMAVTFSLSTVLVFIFSKTQKVKSTFPNHKKRLVTLVLLGMALFLVAITLNYAFKTGMTSYIITVKRLSILFNVLLGVIFLNEKQGLRNLLAGGIMVAGAIIIGVSDLL